MCAHEDRRRARVPLDHLDDLPLGTPRIRNQDVPRRRVGRVPDVLGNTTDRRAHDHDIRLGHPGVQVGGAPVDRAQTNGQIERGLVAPHPDDLRRYARLRNASPIDPPIKPTPTIATVSRRSKARPS